MEHSDLTKAQCAAIFVMLLDDGAAAQMLGGLGPDQLEIVGASMCELGEIPPADIARAIAAFIAEADQDAIPAGGRTDQVRSLLTQAIGDVKTENMMQRISPQTRPRSLEMARWLAPPVLAKLVEQEHAQVIAVLLLMLEPQMAAEILALLPEPVQPRVVERIARLGPVSSTAVDMLDQLLTARIADSFGSSALTLGGAREAANLINAASGAVGQKILPSIEQRDADLARAIEAEMFTFEMLLDLDPMAMGRLLRDVENETLVDALKGMNDDERAPFFAAMSSRAADGVKDEIELRGRIRRDDVLAAQKQMVETARRLSDEGEIVMGADDGDFV